MKSDRALGVRWILALALASGAVTLVLELSAVRLLSPWFGATSGVWTHVIGVILLALAAGYLLGARLARGERALQSLGWVLWIACAVTAWLPALAQPIAGWFMPEGLALDQAAGLVRWGSLAAALLLFGPATFVLGCVAPLASELYQRARGSSAGDAGGRVLCVSTLGSLAGSFATTYVLIPSLGLSWTYLACAGVLALLALVVTLHARLGGRTLGALAIAAVALPVSRLQPPSPGEGARILESCESAYQSVRVVERVGADGQPAMRFLQVNEGFDSFQSAWQPQPGLLPDGYYYNTFALPSAWDGSGRQEWRILVLGLGAGTAWRVIEGTLPQGTRLEGDGVEIDARVIELASRWMDLDSRPELCVHAGMDARACLAALPGDYDQVIVDAYANQVEIPAHLSTLEFFREVRTKLKPRGWLSLNIGGFGFEDPVVDALGRTLAAAFDRRVLEVKVPFSRNIAVLARADGGGPEPASAAFLGIAPAGLARLASQVSVPGMWRWVSPSAGELLVDDRNPIERLQERSLQIAARSREAGAP